MDEREYRERIALIVEVGIENMIAERVLLYLLEHMGGNNMAYARRTDIEKTTRLTWQEVSSALAWLSRQKLIEIIEDGDTCVIQINRQIGYV